MVKEFFKYLIVGGVAFAVDYSLLFFLSEYWGIYYLISATFSFSAGIFIAYYLSVSWVFSARSISNKNTEFLIFLAIGVIGLLLNILIMWWMTDFLNFHYMISKLFSAGLVFCSNFAFRKILLFSDCHRCSKQMLHK